MPVAEPLAAAPIATDNIAPPEAAPTPSQTSDVTGMLALALMGLVGLAVGGFALLAFRRRPKKAYRSAPTIETPVVASRSPVPTASVAPAMPLATQPMETGSFDTTDGAPVVLPSQMPESFEERDALLKRMVAAKPDRANPFVSYKARVHRARLILQSLGRRFENSRPWIDLSQYSRNWPTLARRPSYRTA